MSQGKVLASRAFDNRALRLQQEEATERDVERPAPHAGRAWLVTLGGSDRRRVTVQVDADTVDVIDGSLVFLDKGLVCHVQAPGTWRSCAVKGRTNLSRKRVSVVGHVNASQLEDVL